MDKNRLDRLDKAGINLKDMDQYKLLKLLNLAGSDESKLLLDELVDNNDYLSKYGKGYSVSVGDIVFFGHYSCAESKLNGKPFAWIVLKVEDDKALLLSYYIMPPVPYRVQKKKGNILGNWEESSIRQMLNSSFLNASFTNDEQKAIMFTIEGKQNNRPFVFMLSQKEITNIEFLLWEKRIPLVEKQPTDFWLRTLERNMRITYSENYDYYSSYFGEKEKYTKMYTESFVHKVGFPSEERHGIRPAVWLSLKGPNFYYTHFPTEYCLPGNRMSFGSYPYYSENDKQPISWIVIKCSSDSITLMSEKVIDWQPFEVNGDKTYKHSHPWQQCSLKKWLNDIFFSKAFDETERKYIIKRYSEIADDTSDKFVPYSPGDYKSSIPRYKLSGNREIANVNVTLPSYSECLDIGTYHQRNWGWASSDRYYGHEKKGSGHALARPTPYALSKGAQEKNGYCCYWLSSLGANWNSESIGDEEGWLDTRKFTEYCGIRPVITIKMSKETLEYSHQLSINL